MKTPTCTYTMPTMAGSSRDSQENPRGLFAWLLSGWKYWGEHRRLAADLEALTRLDDRALQDLGIAGCPLEQIEMRRAERERGNQALLDSSGVFPW